MATLSMLSNLRLLCLPSESLGEDWYEQSLRLDEALSTRGMELEQESVFLLFDRAPGAVLAGEGNCLIARSIIGPKRDPGDPLVLQDWNRGPALTQGITGKSWPLVLQGALEQWEELYRAGKTLSPGFTLCIRRLQKPQLELVTEVIFRE